jgi:predicted permease
MIVIGLLSIPHGPLSGFSPLVRQVMVLLSVVPMAANTVAIAADLRVHPEKAAVAVLATTFFALVYIPLVVGIALR